MTFIKSILWTEEVSDKIHWKHQVIPQEVEEVLSRNPCIVFKEKGRRNVKENVYIAFGTTESGRYLFVLFILKKGV